MKITYNGLEDQDVLWGVCFVKGIPVEVTDEKLISKCKSVGRFILESEKSEELENGNIERTAIVEVKREEPKPEIKIKVKGRRPGKR